MEADGLVLAVGMHLRDKGCSQCRLAELVKLVVDKAEEDAALAHSRIAHHDHLYLCQVLLHTIIITDNKNITSTNGNDKNRFNVPQ